MILLSAARQTMDMAARLALFGMLGIFGVLGAIMLTVKILNSVTEKRDQKGTLSDADNP